MAKIETSDDPVNGSDRRLGRSVARIHQAEHVIRDAFKPSLETLILAGKSMDFVSRVHGFGTGLTPAAIEIFANRAGLGRQALHNVVLPALKASDVADYTLVDGQVAGINEYLGVTGNLIEQSYRVLMQLRPSRAELAVLHSVEVASYAPLTETQHLDQLVRRAFTEEEAKTGYNLALSAGLNKRIKNGATSNARSAVPTHCRPCSRASNTRKSSSSPRSIDGEPARTAPLHLRSPQFAVSHQSDIDSSQLFGPIFGVSGAMTATTSW